jgi:trimeric autotransporter adhesin
VCARVGSRRVRRSMRASGSASRRRGAHTALKSLDGIRALRQPNAAVSLSSIVSLSLVVSLSWLLRSAHLVTCPKARSLVCHRADGAEPLGQVREEALWRMCRRRAKHPVKAAFLLDYEPVATAAATATTAATDVAAKDADAAAIGDPDHNALRRSRSASALPDESPSAGQAFGCKGGAAASAVRRPPAPRPARPAGIDSDDDFELGSEPRTASAVIATAAAAAAASAVATAVAGAVGPGCKPPGAVAAAQTALAPSPSEPPQAVAASAEQVLEGLHGGCSGAYSLGAAALVTELPPPAMVNQSPPDVNDGAAAVSAAAVTAAPAHAPCTSLSEMPAADAGHVGGNGATAAACDRSPAPGGLQSPAVASRGPAPAVHAEFAAAEAHAARALDQPSEAGMAACAGDPVSTGVCAAVPAWLAPPGLAHATEASLQRSRSMSPAPLLGEPSTSPALAARSVQAEPSSAAANCLAIGPGKWQGGAAAAAHIGAVPPAPPEDTVASAAPGSTPSTRSPCDAVCVPGAAGAQSVGSALQLEPATAARKPTRSRAEREIERLTLFRWDKRLSRCPVGAALPSS